MRATGEAVYEPPVHITVHAKRNSCSYVGGNPTPPSRRTKFGYMLGNPLDLPVPHIRYVEVKNRAMRTISREGPERNRREPSETTRQTLRKVEGKI